MFYNYDFISKIKNEHPICDKAFEAEKLIHHLNNVFQDIASTSSTNTDKLESLKLQAIEAIDDINEFFKQKGTEVTIHFYQSKVPHYDLTPIHALKMKDKESKQFIIIPK